MKIFMIMLLISLIVSSIGFIKYVWFISIGYGLSIAAIGLSLILFKFNNIHLFELCLSLMLIIYGLRLSGYLLVREIKSSSYNNKMKTEIKDGKSISLFVKIMIWISASLLYAMQSAPIYFRVIHNKGIDLFVLVGLCIMIFGLVFESIADYQKNKAKKINPSRFVDSGLYKIVRCPNYLGEMLFWSGVFISGISCFNNIGILIISLLGYLGIIYVMFGGARRLEIRQNKHYGNDKDYQGYIKSVPILLPFIPLYSVEKYKWLVA